MAGTHGAPHAVTGAVGTDPEAHRPPSQRWRSSRAVQTEAWGIPGTWREQKSGRWTGEQDAAGGRGSRLGWPGCDRRRESALDSGTQHGAREGSPQPAASAPGVPLPVCIRGSSRLQPGPSHAATPVPSRLCLSHSGFRRSPCGPLSRVTGRNLATRGGAFFSSPFALGTLHVDRARKLLKSQADTRSPSALPLQCRERTFPISPPAADAACPSGLNLGSRERGSSSGVGRARPSQVLGGVLTAPCLPGTVPCPAGVLAK